MISMVEYVHKQILNYNGYSAVDFTMGNGFDTYFLAQHFHEVYAFDIQEEAIINTQNRCKDFDNIIYVLDNHKNIDKYCRYFDVGIFNLGYLPHSNKQIKTEKSSTIEAIKKAIEMMNKALFIVVYPGHKEGYDESIVIDDYVSHLDTHKFNVSEFKMLNKNKSPYVIEIEKR